MTERAPLKRQGLTSNIAWLSLGNAAAKPVWFLFITAVCTRVLGASEYGALTSSLAVVGLGVSLTEMGTNEYVTREIARDGRDGASLLSSLIVGRLALGAIVVALLPLSVFLGRGSAEAAALTAAGAYTVVFRLSEFLRTTYRSAETLQYEAGSLVLERALVIAAGLAGLLWTRTAWGTLVGLLAGVALSAALNAAWIRRRILPLALGAFRWDVLVRAYRAALPLGLLGLASIALNVVPYPVIEAMLGLEAVGRYGAAAKAIEMLQLFPAIVAAPLLPRLARLHHSDDEASYRHALLRGLGLTAAGALAIAIGLAVFAPLVVRVLAPGDGFEGTTTVLRALAFAYPLMAIGLVVTAAMVASDRHTWAAAVTAIGAALCTGLTVILVRQMGTLGGAIALGVSHGVVLLLLLIGIRRASASSSAPTA